MARKGSITQEDREFVETWENISPATNAIIRLDMRGDEKHELISGTRTFMVTSEERMLTQDRIRDPKNDPFLNGCFRPVVVPETVTIESNPNALSDEEISSILLSSDVAWTEWMTVLTSPETLSRMIERCAEIDDVSLKRYKQLEQRLAEVKPKSRVTQKDSDQYESIRTGGRSSDYRSTSN